MWKYALMFLVIFPAAILTGVIYFYRKWKAYPVGAVDAAKARRKEWERVKEARKELRKVENGG